MCFCYSNPSLTDEEYQREKEIHPIRCKFSKMSLFHTKKKKIYENDLNLRV